MKDPNQAQLMVFSSRFDELAEIIEEAHRYGTSIESEEQYSRLRQWFLIHYKNVRETLRSVMADSGERKGWLNWPGEDLDCFELLIKPPTLDGIARWNDEVLILRLRVIRTAISELKGSHVFA